MQYILTVVHAIYNTGSVTEVFKFEYFYDMQDFIIDNCNEWISYGITTGWEV